MGDAALKHTRCILEAALLAAQIEAFVVVPADVFVLSPAKAAIEGFEGGEHLVQQPLPVLFLSGLQSQRCGRSGEPVGELRLVDIDAAADDATHQALALQIVFYQYAAHLAPRHIDVVGPLDAHFPFRQTLLQRPGYGQRYRLREDEGLGGQYALGLRQHAEEQIAPRFRIPAVASLSAPRRLLFGYSRKQVAVLLLEHVVGGGAAVEMQSFHGRKAPS